MKKKDEYSLVHPQHNIGSKLLQEAHKKSIQDMQEKVVGDVQRLIKRKANLEVQEQQIGSQIDHIKMQLTAIENSEFTVVGNKIKFHDEPLNQDCAIAYPYHAENM